VAKLAVGNRARDVTLLVALIAIGLALLGPRLGKRVILVPATGIDVVFLVDVSRSMDARDVPPSRLDRARRAAQELLARLGSEDRAGLAVFGSRGLLLAPLTPDRGALVEFLSSLDTGLVTPAGSNLGAGIEAALTAFAPASERPGIVFVLSDGEDPERGRNLGVARATAAGVRVLAAALGSDLGAEIPDHGVPLRDGTGQTILTRRDPSRLERLADATDGEVFAGDRWGDFDFARAAASIRRDAAASHGAPVPRRVDAVRVAPLVAVAFLLLLAEMLPRPKAWLRSRGAVIAAGLTAVALLTAAAPANPDDAHRWLALGLARLEERKPESAARAFVAAAVIAHEPELAALAYYNLGVAALEQRDLETARDAFFDSLALAPGDSQARFNLEWTLLGLAVRPPPSPPEPRAKEESGRSTSPLDESPPETTESDLVPTTSDVAGPTPSEAERARLLGRVIDDPTRGFRSGRDPNKYRRPSGLAW
jgi:Ca-activated chloride channel family protein